MEGERCYRGFSWMMDGSVSKDREQEEDLESGGTTSEEDRICELGLEKEQRKRFLDMGWDGHFGSYESVRSSRYVSFLKEKNSEGEEGQQEMMSCVDLRNLQEKHKKKSCRNPSKPPRPPKGPSLDAADHKLVKEIAELAMRKRARIEQIKALKKMRAAKTASWSSSLTATVITVLFLLVIAFQGMCSGDSRRILMRGSPEPALAAGEDLISVQFYKNLSAYEGNEQDSSSPNLEAEGQVSGSGFKRK